MMPEWEGKIFFRPCSKESGKRQPFEREAFTWHTGDTTVLRGKLLMPLGELTSQFLKVDCDDQAKVTALLEDWGNPPIYSEGGKLLVTLQEVSHELKKEQLRLIEFIENVLIPLPMQRKGTKLKSSQMLHLWRLKLVCPEAGKRIARIFLEPGTIQETDSTKELREIREALEFNEAALNKRYEELGHNEDVIKNDLRTNKLTEIIETKKMDAILADAKRWKSCYRYVSRDVLALLWQELFHAAEINLTCRRCEVCKSYYIQSSRQYTKVCYNCVPPSRLKSEQLEPKDQLKKRQHNTIYKQYLRKTISLIEANEQLRKMGLPIIKPRKRR